MALNSTSDDRPERIYYSTIAWNIKHKTILEKSLEYFVKNQPINNSLQNANQNTSCLIDNPHGNKNISYLQFQKK